MKIIKQGLSHFLQNLLLKYKTINILSKLSQKIPTHTEFLHTSRNLTLPKPTNDTKILMKEYHKK